MRGHGEGTISQRKDGRWQAQISLGDGKRKTLYGKTRKEVRDKLQTALKEQKQGTLILAPNQTLETYLTYWLNNMSKLTTRARTYEQYLSVIQVHLIPELGKIELHKLTIQHVQNLYSRLHKEGLAPATIAGIHTVLHKALNDALKNELVARNVSSLTSRPTVRRREPQVLTAEQANKLLEVARGHRMEAFIVLALTTAARRGELLGLHWDDIDFEHKIMSIRRSIGRVKGRGILEGEAKAKSSRRIILLTDIAIELLREQRIKQDELRLKAGEKWVDKGLVFCGVNGNFFDFKTALTLFGILLSEAGLPHMRLHDLRHSAATILLVRGVHPKIVQEMLGHSKISMTMDVYSHVLPSMQQSAIDKMNDVFKRP